ncbi:hypothetical protein QBC46DRAFT_346001 [Diplogelasinospora grovesii]|uniref:Uncharacterized protein n=1 Tax=Diplogelasinospora grovesii TaxID=303347 RepID=A0AAN6S109_9PEZI|nr:hypothetical protein QBC46DRAFT_346001 [Diplogelasinospora grovesii]
MKFTLSTLALLASSLALVAAAPASVPDQDAIIKSLKERNPACVPFCLYPGDTCCSCCH